MKNKTSRKPSDESVVYRRFVGEPIKRSRKGESRFEKSQEWRLAQADLDKRNFVPNEHIMFALTDERKRELGIQNRRTIARFLKKYIEKQGMKDYYVKAFRKENRDVVMVSYLPVVRQKA